MNQNRSGGGSKGLQEPFAKAFGEVKNQTADLADQVGGAAQDLYSQARDSASQVADAAGKSGEAIQKVPRLWRTLSATLLKINPTRLSRSHSA